MINVKMNSTTQRTFLKRDWKRLVELSEIFDEILNELKELKNFSLSSVQSALCKRQLLVRLKNFCLLLNLSVKEVSLNFNRFFSKFLSIHSKYRISSISFFRFILFNLVSFSRVMLSNKIENYEITLNKFNVDIFIDVSEIKL